MLFPNTRFRYIHDVNKTTVQGTDVLDLSWNKKGYGIFFTVNGFPPTGMADQSRLLSLNANYVDFDVDVSLSHEEKDKLIQETLMVGMEANVPAPTIVNRTQKGAHLIWLYSELLKPTPENVEMWKGVQKRLVRCFNGDRAAVDPSRVLRLPYTLHLKDPANPFEIRIMSYKPDARCTLDELDAGVPKLVLEDKAPMRVNWGEFVSTPIREGGRNDAATKYAGKLLHDLSPELWQTAGWDSLRAWNRDVAKPPLDEKELRASFESVANLQIQSRKEKRKDFSSRSTSSKAITVRFADIQAETIKWLWPERIALGKLTLIIGDPDVGKSLLTVAMAAVVSNGFLWPVDKTESPTGDVILISAEDDAADTIKPRLEAAEADSRRVHVLESIKVVDPDGVLTQRMFSLKQDLLALEERLISLPDCKLVVVDPISAYLDDTDSHRNASVRGLLAPLAALAAKRKIAMVAIDHFNKNSSESNKLYRAGGSLAFVAAARAVYVVYVTKPSIREQHCELLLFDTFHKLQ